MEATIYRRHQKDCKSKDRYDPRCGCPLWYQFNWKGISGQFDGKKLKHGQNKWSSELTSMSKAQAAWGKLSEDLDALLEGKPASEGKTVQEAVDKWLRFRETNGLMNAKAKLMCGKLVRWCEENGILMLSAITPAATMDFRMSLPFLTGRSSSLAVHWSIIGGFFNWCVGSGYITASPIPNTRQFPQFKIKYKKADVLPPTPKQVEQVLLMADSSAAVLLRLMRETAMALVDAQKFGMSDGDVEKLDAEKLEMSVQEARKLGLLKPERRPVLMDTLIRGKRTKTGQGYRVRISLALKQQLEALGSPAFPGTYTEWRERCNKAIRKAGVEMTPHGLRHLRISEWLAQGIQVSDVSKWVGASDKEIRKTYEHWIKEAEDRLDEIQRQSWLKMGLDENGNSRETTQ